MNPLQMISQLVSKGFTPQQIVQELLRGNPNGQILINQMQSSGMNPRQFAEQLAKQNNVNLGQLEQMIRNTGIRL